MEELDKIKLAHESFVSGHNGSSAVDVILAVLPIVPGAFLASSFHNLNLNYLWKFCIEYILCILPLILSFTLLCDVALEFNSIMFLLLLIRILYVQRSGPIQYDFKKNDKITYLTSSRATVNVATIIAILAVDFHIFPRRFAKTESYGYSLMDVGAACYLFMNGITDIRKKKIFTGYSLKDIFILTLLGLLRLASVKTTNYQEHVTEYGVHCNFFFTLAAIKVLSILGISRISSKSRIIFCICLGIFLEMILQNSLEKWTLSHSSRIGILEANREWVVSLPGNILIYIIGICVGEIIFSQKSNFNYFKNSLPLLPFLILFILEFLFPFEPSRRISNLAFVLWIIGFFLFFLNLFRIIENLFLESSCRLLQSINHYALFFFLMGNLLTGAINKIINTLEINNLNSFLIINMYCLSLCSIVYFMYYKKVKLKE